MERGAGNTISELKKGKQKNVEVEGGNGETKSHPSPKGYSKIVIGKRCRDWDYPKPGWGDTLRGGPQIWKKGHLKWRQSTARQIHERKRGKSRLGGEQPGKKKGKKVRETGHTRSGPARKSHLGGGGEEYFLKS